LRQRLKPRIFVLNEDPAMKVLFSAIALAILLAACGDDASKKGTTTGTPTTPPPAEKKTEPKK